jgi:predicted DNA-binding transcriptional regulator AlpA
MWRMETEHIAAAPDELIALPVLRRRLGGISRVTVWRGVRAGRLPAPVRVGGRVLWSSAEIDAWIAGRLAAREQPA